MEVACLQLEQATGREGDHGGPAGTAFEQGELAEEGARTQGTATAAATHQHLSLDQEVHGVAPLAAPDQRVAGGDLARLEEAGQLGELAGRDLAEDGHPRDHRRRHGEIALLQLLHEAGAEDGGGQREHADAEHGDEGGHQPPERGGRHHVAVAHRRERRHRPPHGGGDGAEGLGLHRTFHRVHDAGRNEEQHRHHPERQAEGVALVDQHHLEDGQGARIAHELQDPQHPQQPQHDETAGRQQAQIEGQDGDQIDQRRRRHRIAQPPPQGMGVTAAAVLHHRPQPGQVLDREHGHDEDLEIPEEIPQQGRDPRQALDDGAHHANQDQQDEQAAQPVAGRPLLAVLVHQQFEQPGPQSRMLLGRIHGIAAGRHRPLLGRHAGVLTRHPESPLRALAHGRWPPRDAPDSDGDAARRRPADAACRRCRGRPPPPRPCGAGPRHRG